MQYLILWKAIYILSIAGVLGAVLASFLGCAASRRLRGESVFRGRSHCDLCNHVLGPGDLVPILSYLFRRGRCRWCGEKIPSICLWSELTLAGLFMLFLLRFNLTPELSLYLFFLCVLYYISLTDLEDHTIPNGALLLAVLVRMLWFMFWEFSWKNLLVLLIGGLSLSVPVLLLTLLLERLLEREAMGGGDIKLLAVLGMYLGWALGMMMLLFACLAGILGALIVQKREEKEIPFGPFLSLGAVFAILFGEKILLAYFSLFF